MPLGILLPSSISPIVTVPHILMTFQVSSKILTGASLRYGLADGLHLQLHLTSGRPLSVQCQTVSVLERSISSLVGEEIGI